MKRLQTSMLALLFLASSAALSANGESANDYWPTWRGPQATGAAPNAHPPLTWSETQNIKWKVQVPGKGSSSPIVWGDRIFFQIAVKTDEIGTLTVSAGSGDQGRDGNRQGGRPFHGGETPANLYKFDLVCLDRNTGRTLWQKTAREDLPHETHHPEHGFASYSPITDGKLVWANFGSRGVHCYDMDGNHQWSVDLGRMTTRNAFGEGSSPALVGDAVVVVMDHEGESFIIALEKETGETIWRTNRDEGTSWSTPVTAKVNGDLQIIINATHRVRSYDAESGDLIWECGGQTPNAIPSPVVGFGKVFCTSGFRGSALQAIELGHTGDLSDSNAISWEVNEATPYVPSPILYGDKVYVCRSNNAVISCYQAETGEANFVKQRLEGLNGIYASPVGAANRVYFVGRNGTTQVLKLSSEFQVLATNILNDKFDASPAIVDDELFLKGKSFLYCISESQGS